MRSTIGRKLATTLAGTAVLAGGFAAASTIDASALGSSCKAWLNTNGGSQQAEGVLSLGTLRSKLLWSSLSGPTTLLDGSMTLAGNTAPVGRQSGVHGRPDTPVLTKPTDSTADNS